MKRKSRCVQLLTGNAHAQSIKINKIILASNYVIEDTEIAPPAGLNQCILHSTLWLKIMLKFI